MGKLTRKVTQSQAKFSEQLQKVVKEGLAATGIEAVTYTEKVPGTRLTRLIVMAGAFEHLSVSERQSLLWRIIDSKFTPDEQMRISLVVAVSRKELGERLSENSGRN